MIEGYVTVKQASKRINLSESYICQLCKSGKLAGAKKIGNLWLIPEDTIKIYAIIHGKNTTNTKEKI